MHPYFSVMDERWFHRAFVYTGSVTDREKNLDFRYRYEQVKGDDGDARRLGERLLDTQEQNVERMKAYL